MENYRSRSNLDPLLKAKSPWLSNHRPEAHATPELTLTKASYYQSLIGVLRWIVELRSGDLEIEVFAMASMIQ